MSRYKIIHNDVLKWAKQYDGPPFHSLLCDPPYHLQGGFMGKDWDKSGIAFQPETWAVLAEHLLPGAFGMAFASARGWHRLACAIEDAGLIIHPSIFCWLTAQGFPKATRIDTQIDKAAGAKRAKSDVKKMMHTRTRGNYDDDNYDWGEKYQAETLPATPLAKTWSGHRYGLQALKPAVEPIIVFQRKYDGKPVDSIMKTGAGALWIDGARIPTSEKLVRPAIPRTKDEAISPLGAGTQVEPQGRWPANFVLDEEAAKRLGQQSIAQGIHSAGQAKPPGGWDSEGGWGFIGRGDYGGARIGDAGTAARFFLNVDWKLEQSEPVLYCPKASRHERDAGLEQRNDHPTLKPIKLTQWLATLLLPPKEYAPRRILIPFAGSGSEMIGALRAGWDEIIGIELEEEYCRIAEARLKHWAEQPIEIPLIDKD